MQGDRERKDAHSASNHYAVSMLVEVYNLKSDTGKVKVKQSLQQPMKANRVVRYQGSHIF
jgi:hypothetical protein